MRYAVGSALLTCKDYSTIRECRYDDDLPALCRVAEEERDDGYAVLASTDGVLVADAAGWWDRDLGPADPILAAYERRFDAEG